MGRTNKRGAPYSASCVKSMVEGPTPSAIARAATQREAILRHTLSGGTLRIQSAFPSYASNRTQENQ
jgi:hypothetical protein